MERIWRFTTLVGLIMCAYYMSLAHPCAKLVYERRPAGYEAPMYTDPQTVVVPGITAAIFFAIKKGFWPLFTPLWRPHCKDQHDEKLWQRRAERCTIEFRKMITFACFSIYSHRLTLDTDFFPKEIGGKGSYKNILSDMPYYTQTPGLHRFSLIMIGYYLGDLLDTVIFSIESNYWEMCFHHLTTVALVVGMTFMGQQRVGAIVFLIHATTDILVHCARFLSNTIYSKTCAVVFMVGLLFWMYYRHYVFSLVVWHGWKSNHYEEGFECNHPLHYTLCVFLTFLCIMHVWWSYCMIDMFFRYYSKKSTEDITLKMRKDR